MKHLRPWMVRAAAAVAATAATTIIAAPAQAQNNREIYVQNECSSPVRFLISHADQPRNWHPHGWWEFQPNQASTRLMVDDRVITQRDDHDLYFYAETTDKTDHVWDGEDHRETFLGVSYGMQRANLGVVRGGLQIRLTCE